MSQSDKAGLCLPSSSQDNEPRINLTKFLSLSFAKSDPYLPILGGSDTISQVKAKSMGADVLAFCERPWLGESIVLPHNDVVEIALLSMESYDKWLSELHKHTRYEIRKAEQAGVEIRVVKKLTPTEGDSILQMLRETPVRGGTHFLGFRFWDINTVMDRFRTDDEFVTVIAIHENKIVGIARTHFNGQVALVRNLYGSVTAREKVRGVANLLMAAQIRLLIERGVKHLVYGFKERSETVIRFQENNGFTFLKVHYNYLLLTRKAKLIASFGLYRPREMVAYKLSFNPLWQSIQRRLPLGAIRAIQRVYGPFA
jgi:hypothetical protein